MTIHGVGTPITMAEIQAEFGGVNPIGLSEYYAGGAYVPAGTTGYYGAIPASGPISMQQFYGATKGNNLVVGSAPGLLYGYTQGGTGSLTPNTAWPFGANTIRSIMWYIDAMQFNLEINANIVNSGWTTMKVGATTFTRASAFFIKNTVTTWYWTTVPNPLPAVGASTPVIFT